MIAVAENRNPYGGLKPGNAQVNLDARAVAESRNPFGGLKADSAIHTVCGMLSLTYLFITTPYL